MMAFFLAVWNVVLTLWNIINRWGRVLVVFLLGFPLFFMVNLMLPNGALQFVISILPVILIVVIYVTNWNIVPERARDILIGVGVWPIVLWLITLIPQTEQTELAWLVILSIIKAIFCILPLIGMAVVLVRTWNLNPRWIRIVSICITTWQFIIFAVLLLPREMFFTIFSFLPVMGFIILAVLWPDIVGSTIVLSKIKNGTRMLVGIGITIGIELAVGFLFSVVPVSFYWIPVVMLIIVTMIALSIDKKSDAMRAVIRFVLLLVFIGIITTFVFQLVFPDAATEISTGVKTRAGATLTKEARSWFASSPPPPSPDTIMVAPRTDKNSNSHDYVMTTIPQSGYTMPIGTKIGIELSKKWTGLLRINDGVHYEFHRTNENDIINIAFDDNANGLIDKNDRIFYAVGPHDYLGNKEGNKRFKLSGTGTVVISASYR